jgi:prephenate dehydratase
VADGELDAALAGSFAAGHYRLVVLASGVHDRAGAVTRFVELGAPGPLPAPTTADRTSVIAYLADDHPGALMDILSQFAMRGVNLSRIESRPTGEGIGRYCFFIDCEGHIARPSVGEALMGLRRTCSDVRFLGSYATAAAPLAQGGTAAAAPAGQDGAADDDKFMAAAAWLEEIRSGGCLPEVGLPELGLSDVGLSDVGLSVIALSVVGTAARGTGQKRAAASLR